MSGSRCGRYGDGHGGAAAGLGRGLPGLRLRARAPDGADPARSGRAADARPRPADAPRRRGRPRRAGVGRRPAHSCTTRPTSPPSGRRPARPAGPTPAHGLGTEDVPGLRGHARGAAPRSPAAAVRWRARRLAGRGRARGELRRRAAPRHAGAGQRVLRLQRRRAGDPRPARRRGPPGRLRRRRRPPRRRRRAHLLGRPAGADDLAARDAAACCSRAPGSPNDVGGPGRRRAARSTSPSRPGTGDAGWLRAFHAVVPAAAARVRARRAGHPARLRLATRSTRWPTWRSPSTRQRASYAALHDLAHEFARRPVGRARRRRVRGRRRRPARVGAPGRHRRAPAAGPGAPTCPAAGASTCGERVGRPGPAPDYGRAPAQYAPVVAGARPGDAVDRAVMATRRAVFPLHGLDPWFD